MAPSDFDNNEYDTNYKNKNADDEEKRGLL